MSEKDPVEEYKMPLMAHLVELRQRIIWSIAAFFVCFLVGYAISGHVFDVLVHPLKVAFEGQSGRRMIFTAPTEAFFTYVRVAFFFGVFVAFPVIASQVWLFVAPGLYKHEKQAFLPFLVATPFMFLLGTALVFYFLMPVALKFFTSFEVPMGQGDGAMPIQLEAKMDEYLSFVMTLILAFGISFQLPVLMVLLVRVGILEAATLASKRRYAIVGIVAFAGIVTPPDVFSQLSLAVPLFLLYEVAIWISYGIERQRKAKELAEEQEEARQSARQPAAAPAAASPRPAAAAAATAVEETDFNLAR